MRVGIIPRYRQHLWSLLDERVLAEGQRAYSSIWIVVTASIRIGVAVVPVTGTIRGSIISITRAVVPRPNRGCASRSAQDSKPDCSTRIIVAATVITAIAHIGHVSEG